MDSRLEVNNAYLLRALDFGWVVRVVGVDGERKQESATLVHACMVPQQDEIAKGWHNSSQLLIFRKLEQYSRTLIRSDGQGEVEEIGGIREIRLHRWRQIQLRQIWAYQQRIM